MTEGDPGRIPAAPEGGTGAPALLDATGALTGGDGGRYLTFALNHETYALDILDITEIIEFRSLTVVPMMPSFIRGVINLRGRVLPVIDLAAGAKDTYWADSALAGSSMTPGPKRSGTNAHSSLVGRSRADRSRPSGQPSSRTRSGRNRSAAARAKA